MQRKYSRKTYLFWWIETKLENLANWFNWHRVESQIKDISYEKV